MSGIGIISNPHSKLNKRNPGLIHSLRQQLGDNGTLFVTQSTEELNGIPEKFRSGRFDTLAICGGDGTISRTLSAFIRANQFHSPLPPIVLLRGGTMNLIANELSQKGTPSQILRALIQRRQTGQDLPICKLRSLEIQNNHGFLYADGSNVAILEEFYLKKSGILGACWLAIRLVSSFLARGPLIQGLIQPKLLHVQFDRKKGIKFCSLGNFAGTISKLPLGFPLLPYAKEDLGHFQMTMITCPKEKLLWYLPQIMLQQKKGQGIGKFATCCEQIKIHRTETFPYTLDGEIYQSQSPQLLIRCGPLVEFLQIKT